MDILFLGHIDGVKFSDNAVFVIASEKLVGYKKKDGTIVNPEVCTYTFIFKPYFRKYIAEHFSSGMLVKIKGTMLPYAKDHQGNNIDGFTLLGQTIDIAAYQTSTAKIERKRMYDSKKVDMGMPNVEEYQQDDF